jgi:hypothetical protein
VWDLPRGGSFPDDSEGLRASSVLLLAGEGAALDREAELKDPLDHETAGWGAVGVDSPVEAGP